MLTVPLPTRQPPPSLAPGPTFLYLGAMEGTAPPRTRPPRKRSAAWSLRPKTAIPGDAGVVTGHRYYNPGIGRWVSRDPIGEQGGLSLHAVLANCPASAIDALGLFFLGPHVNKLQVELCKPAWWELDMAVEAWQPTDPEWNGAIIQLVEQEYQVWDCCNKQLIPDKPGPKNVRYYEAWGVLNGEVVGKPGLSISSDIYGVPYVHEGTQGYAVIRGLFAFYTATDFWPYLSWFTGYTVPEAGLLWAYPSPPMPDLPGFSSRREWYREMYVSWRCCPGNCWMNVMTTFSYIYEPPLSGTFP